MKAQSAIEYLVTYGWMLVSVTVVAGTVFSVADLGSCTESATGFSTQSITVEDFGLNSDEDLDFLLRNSENDRIDVKEIRLESGDQSSIAFTNLKIEPGSSGQASVTAVEGSSDCSTFDVQLVYDRGVLRDLTTSGTVRVEASLIDLDPPSDPENPVVSLS